MISRIKTRIRLLSKAPFQYRYKNFTITLPADHMLPAYQESCPKYDRFLPHIAKHIKSQGTVIDIEANVGDTLASMVEQNPLLDYICVEADESFYKLLESNIKKIKRVEKELKVQTFQNLIGDLISNVTLEGKGGTKHAVENTNGEIKSIPLDRLIDGTPHSKVCLLKTDVDGFDYDVLNSSITTIKKYSPILFFELYFDYEYQKSGY